MQKLLSIVVLTAVVATPAALPCGDKFVAFGQGVRLQRIYAAEHPAAILIYVRPESPLGQPVNRDRLTGLLRLAGHRPQVVSTLAELQGAAATGEFDLLLTEPADASSVRDLAKSATIVQILWEPKREEIDQLDCAAAVSKRSHDLLLVVNDVMEQRHKGVASVSCRRKRT